MTADSIINVILSFVCTIQRGRMMDIALSRVKRQVDPQSRPLSGPPATDRSEKIVNRVIRLVQP